MIVKLLTEHHLQFLALKGGCGCSSESTLVKMSNCWKSQSTVHFIIYVIDSGIPQKVESWKVTEDHLLSI